MITFIGDHPLARGADGKLCSRIATAFPRGRALVTVPGIHAAQRFYYTDALNQKREQMGLAPLTDEEQEAEWAQSVDLIVDDDAILIRPDPDNMALAFEADEMLQELVSKRKVRFLMVLNDRVRNAIQRRGEAWRIHPLPKSSEQIRRMIVDSRIAIHGRPIYYYNPSSGTRWLTVEEFSSLGQLDDEALRRHLMEIAEYCAKRNARYRLEVDFFSARGFGSTDFAHLNFATMPPGELRHAFAELVVKFKAAVPLALHADDLEYCDWYQPMYYALIDPREDLLTEEALLGLSSDFFMQVQWLPGARLEEGEVIFDSVFEEADPAANGTPGIAWEDTVRGLICNLIQDYGDIEYVNVGRVSSNMARRESAEGRRDVFVVQVKQHESSHDVLQLIRMQKWDVRERLDQGHDLLRAMLDSEAYTEYILDRRVGCRQLGMNLSPRTATRKLTERYSGRQRHLEGMEVRSAYFQRDFIHGLASCKVPSVKLANPHYALRLARALGRAAAPNLIVGRCDAKGQSIFDDGDEVVVEDAHGMPIEVHIADHTGTFGNYRGDLRDLAPHYDVPIRRRLAHLTDPQAFRQTYLDAFVERFEQIQAEYRLRKRAFDTLFKHRKPNPDGNLAYRWLCVLARLERSKPRELVELIP